MSFVIVMLALALRAAGPRASRSSQPLRQANRKWVHGLPLHGPLASIQASGATLFTRAIDHTQFKGVDVRDLLAREIAERTVGARVIDVGCGSGVLTRRLDRRLDNLATIVGVDSSRAMVEQARRESPNLPFVHADAFDITGTYDVACVSFVFHEVPARDHKELLTHLTERTQETFVLDVDPDFQTMQPAPSFHQHLFEPFIRDYCKSWHESLASVGGQRLELLLPPGVCAWHIASPVADAIAMPEKEECDERERKERERHEREYVF